MKAIALVACIGMSGAYFAQEQNHLKGTEFESSPNSIEKVAESRQLMTFDVAVYPNPSNNQKINIETEISLDTIELINLNGQLVQKINKPQFTNNTYSLENLPQGFYFVKLSSTDNQTTTKKILVN